MIKELLNKLPKEKYKELMYAFEYDIPQYVTINDTEFIGVNCHNFKNLIIDHDEGHWSCGKLNNEQTS